MRGAIFKRHEVVYYAVGMHDPTGGAEVLAETLRGEVANHVVGRLSSKAIVYMERIGQASVHRKEDLKRVLARAQKRALEFNHMEIG